MSVWPYSGNASLTGPQVCHEDDFDAAEFYGDLEALYGFGLDQPSERERALHRTARRRSHAPGQTHNEQESM